MRGGRPQKRTLFFLSATGKGNGQDEEEEKIAATPRSY
jgi:hypothetical protein